jgi:hypothetical protein
MKSKAVLIVIFFLMLFFTGCVSQNRNDSITITSLDPAGLSQDTVGNFDVYTGSFRITNPTNSTYGDVDVAISLAPVSSYCHGLTKTFNFPRFFPLEKKTVQISIAEFGSLDCQYNYSYNVFSKNIP